MRKRSANEAIHHWQDPLPSGVVNGKGAMVNFGQKVDEEVVEAKDKMEQIIWGLTKRCDKGSFLTRFRRAWMDG